MKDIFQPIVKEAKLDTNFRRLRDNDLFKPANRIIQNITSRMPDKDGNFIQQFQSDGFNARLWEIYLFMFLTENNFKFINDVDRPDFHVKKNGRDFFIEASLSAEKNEDIFTEEFIRLSVEKNDLDIQQQVIEYYIIRLGSVLFSKLNKKYWELDWVKGKPIILAITPSHNYIANFLPDAKIIEYLYGIRTNVNTTELGITKFETEKVLEHNLHKKTIPSNFFAQPLTENISAVIFTNNSDIYKFNRMGYESKMIDKEFIMVRSGLKFNPDSDAFGKEFTYQVLANGGNEKWSESVSVFHNPNANIKIEKSLFENVRQLWLNSDNEFDGVLCSDYVYHSITGVVNFPIHNQIKDF